MASATTSRATLLVISLLALLLIVVLIIPFFTPLFLAAVIATTFEALRGWLTAKLNGRERLAAALITVGVLLLLLLPLATVGTLIVAQAANAVDYVRGALEKGGLPAMIDKLPAPLRDLAAGFKDFAPKDIQAYIKEHGRGAVEFAGTALVASGRLLLATAILLVALYFLLADGRKLVAWMVDAMPLNPVQTRALFSEFHRVSVAVLLSTVLTSLVQAGVATIGYVIAGVPNFIVFSFLTFLFGFVPIVGAAFIVYVVGAVQIMQGSTGFGIFLIVWGAGVVGIVDNFVKPIFLRGRMDLHVGVIFFGLIGGLAAFGPIGLLAGPMIVSLFVVTARMWRAERVGT